MGLFRGPGQGRRGGRKPVVAMDRDRRTSRGFSPAARMGSSLRGSRRARPDRRTGQQHDLQYAEPEDECGQCDGLQVVPWGPC